MRVEDGRAQGAQHLGNPGPGRAGDPPDLAAGGLGECRGGGIESLVRQRIGLVQGDDARFRRESRAIGLQFVQHHPVVVGHILRGCIDQMQQDGATLDMT